MKETWAAYKNVSKSEKRPKLVRLIVIWGSTALSLFALPFTYWETVASERTSFAIRQVASNAADKAAALDPKNQPIRTIEGYAFLHLRGTNLLHQAPQDVPYGYLFTGQFPHVNSNQWKIQLITAKPTSFFGQNDMTLAFEFKMNPMHPLYNASADTAGAIENWDVVWIDCGVIGYDRELIDGWATVTINSISTRKWLFPPQISYTSSFTSMATKDGYKLYPLGQAGSRSDLFEGGAK
ncbi:MAG: hypothetical protein M9920_12755 [Verrucomicrobiae bacterium]|nr:hypothetical protein [Verrucomicrobiae bacterium]